MIQHERLVWWCVNRLADRLDRDPDDLFADGYIGLQQATERFDPSRGFAFSTYAVPRIAGAILDGERARRGWRKSTQGKRRLADTIPLGVWMPSDETTDADLLVEDRAVTVRRAILSLPEQERVVLSLRYFESLEIQQIAPVLGVGASRVSQIHTAALALLRRRLTGLV